MNRALSVTVAVSAIASMAAVPPARINFQGVLRSSTNAPLTGTYDVVLRLWSAPAGGDEILVDSHTAGGGNAVQVTGGLFNTQIGGGTVTDGPGPGVYVSVIPVFRDYANVYVEVRVGAETLTPRIQVMSAGHALNTENANRLDNLDSTQLLRSDASSTLSSGTLSTSAPTTLAIGGALQLPAAAISGAGPGSGLDADLLDGLSSTYYSPAVHTHDGGDVTSAVGSAKAAPWAGLTGMPAGFADGVDDDSGQAGGLPFRPFEITSFTTKVQATSTGIAIGSDGLPLIVSTSTSGLAAWHCDDVSCRTATSTTLDSGTRTRASVTIGGDGLPLVSYVDDTLQLRVAHCINVPCTSATISILGGQVVSTSITTSSNGLGVIAADQSPSGAGMSLVSCSNATCSSAVFSQPEALAGRAASITMGPRGFPVIAYVSFGLGLRLITCLDAPCGTISAVTLAAVDATATAVTVRADARTVVARAFNSSAYVHTCDTPSCGSSSSASVGSYTDSLAMVTAIDGEAILIVDDDIPGGPDRIAPARGGIRSLVGPQVSLVPPNYPSVAIGQDGLPIVAWVDSLALDVMHCSNPACIPHFRGR